MIGHLITMLRVVYLFFFGEYFYSFLGNFHVISSNQVLLGLSQVRRLSKDDFTQFSVLFFFFVPERKVFFAVKMSFLLVAIPRNIFLTISSDISREPTNSRRISTEVSNQTIFSIFTSPVILFYNSRLVLIFSFFV